MTDKKRRDFVKKSISATAGIGLFSAFPGFSSFADGHGDMFFKISLAEWSLNKPLFRGDLNNLDFPAKAKNDFGINAVEYVNQFFMDKAKNQDGYKN